MQISPVAVQILARSSVEGNHLRLPNEQLLRADYVAVNKALTAIGGKWNRKVKAHVFAECPADKIDAMVLTGEITVPRDFDFFETPEPVLDQIIETITAQYGPLRGVEVLEPSAGRGAIARRLRQEDAAVTCVDVLPENIDELRKQGFFSWHADFLEFACPPPHGTYGYQVIAMNPPFTRQADIRHVKHALGFLSAGGLLVSVMSAGVSFRSNFLTSDFRELVARRGGRIEPLPEGSFKSSGTMVSTVLAVVPGE